MAGRHTLFAGRIYLPAATVAALVCPAFAQEAKQTVPPPSVPAGNFGYFVVAGVAVVAIVALATIRSGLLSSSWSLSDALSEEADITPLNSSGKPYTGLDGKALIASEMRASSSRFIALIGLVVIVTLYTGFGLEILSDYGNSGQLPKNEDIQQMMSFFWAGSTMFAPYAFNKISAAFDWVKPAK